jgi:hypothetical protein
VRDEICVERPRRIVCVKLSPLRAVSGVCYILTPSLSRNPLIEGCVFARLPDKIPAVWNIVNILYRAIHKSVKHFKNSQQIDYAADHSYADRETLQFFLHIS